VQRTTEAVAAMLAVALVASGCATETLWGDKTYHPADHPELQLSSATERHDILVQYNEQHADSKKIRRRAYWLFASTNALANHSYPEFVKPKTAAGLPPIPVFEEMPGTNTLRQEPFAAVATPAEQGFDLWLQGECIGRFYLPVYVNPPRRTVWRILSTPFAALGDATAVILITAAAVALVAGLIYLASQSG
jgi:hypothetical protein